MASRIFTVCVAVFFLFLGVSAFVPRLNAGPSAMYPADLKVKLGFHELFNELPINYLLAGILLGFAASGFYTSLTARGARLWCRIVFVTSLLFMALGFCPQPLASVFYLIPLYGWTTAIFLCLAALTSYFAWFDGPVSPTLSEPVFRQ